VLPLGSKHQELAHQVGVLRVFHRFPISSWMATLVSPILRSMVIWFGSLEFMSTGFGYDMILLSVKGPGGARIMPTRSKAPKRPRHHASPPKRRRGQHRHRPSSASRSSPRTRRAVVQEPTAPCTEATGTTARRHDGHATASGGSVPRAPSPLMVLLPLGLFAARRAHPFGIDNAATSLARTICPDARTYMEQPSVLSCGAGTQQQVQQAAEQSDFSLVRGLRHLGPGRYTITSLRQQLAELGRVCFYTAESDPNSESDSYDPTRKFFNIDEAVATTDYTQDAAASGRAPIAREDPRTPGNDGQVDPPPQDDKAAILVQLRELKAKLNEDRERLTQLERALERDQPHPHGGGTLHRSSEMRSQSHSSAASLEPARTSWQRPCCCVT